MQQPPASPSIIKHPSQPAATDARLHGRGLVMARAGWIALALILLANFVANLPAYYQSAQTLCNSSDPAGCPTGQLTPVYAHLLDQLHLSVAVVVVLFASLTIAVSLAYWVMGLLIFWRKSQDWTGLLASLALVMLGAIGIFAFPTAQTPRLVFFLDNGIDDMVPLALFIFIFTFPTGRFTPRWTLAPFALLVVGALPFVPSLVSLLLLPLAVGVQVYRYVRIYDMVQRQQAKWFVFGFGSGTSCLAAYYLLNAVVPGWNAPDSWYQLLNPLTWLLLWTLMLLSISIAILRYRLWDIDTIINKALVYGLLTGLLGALYAGLIIGLEDLVGLFGRTTAQNPLVLVVSTLAIAALFLPVRRRIQAIIDRRFYRRKYDAEKTLAAFSATLRNEVDLEQLSEQLIAVVNETMQPAHVSLWLRPPERRAEEPA